MRRLSFKHVKLKVVFILFGLMVHLTTEAISLPSEFQIASTDICDNLELTIENQLSERYLLDVAQIHYQRGQGNPLRAGTQAAYRQTLTEIMHPAFTLYGLLHGQIQADLIIHVIDTNENQNTIVDTFDLSIDAHGSGKIRGLCVIQTNVNIHEISLSDERKGLVTVERQNHDLKTPRVKVGVWRLAK